LGSKVKVTKDNKGKTAPFFRESSSGALSCAALLVGAATPVGKSARVVELDGAGNTVEENSSVSCLQCFDTVGWAAGRASGP